MPSDPNQIDGVTCAESSLVQHRGCSTNTWVNIYPQEVENLLVTHPKVLDVAVVGVPSEEFGEEVKAVVQPMAGVAPGDALAAELMAFCRRRLSSIKCPRSIDFEAELPRQENGKLYKRLLKDRYWGKADSTIV